MRFVFFTDIHLLENKDSIIGFEKCLDRMLAFEPQLLINGGDLGVTPEAVKTYHQMIQKLPIPVYQVNGNHEICNGLLAPEQAGQLSRSFNHDGVHFVIFDTVRFFPPTDEHPHNWYFVADQQNLDWLSTDLADIPQQMPIILASHCSISTSAPVRFGQQLGMEFPINEVTAADKVLDLLKPFDNVATLHGHDHENCRHRVDGIQILTTAAVAGSWWKNGLQSPNISGEPQGFRVIDVTSEQIESQYVTLEESQSQLAFWYSPVESGRHFINVFDASTETKVNIENIGELQPLDPFSDSAKGLSPHLYELSSSQLEQIGSSELISVSIEFENGQTSRLEINCPSVK
ncbi:MAG: metallophosphoesterase [Candidatus Poribacteria bacterium]|nr:metallophosphoesterase [Candidatus Poribacteria bacterium]